MKNTKKKSSLNLRGGCLCGNIRFKIKKVYDAGYCHCSRCKKGNGAPVIAWAHVNNNELILLKGKPKRFLSSRLGFRCFCKDCGSPLYFEGKDGKYFSVNIGTLDHPKNISPTIHVCIENKVSWLNIKDNLPRFRGNRTPHPDKR